MTCPLDQRLAIPSAADSSALRVLTSPVEIVTCLWNGKKYRNCLAVCEILINFAGIFIVWWFFPLPFFFVIPGGCILLDSLLMEKIFKRYMPEAEGNPEETGVDEWYRE